MKLNRVVPAAVGVVLVGAVLLTVIAKSKPRSPDPALYGVLCESAQNSDTDGWHVAIYLDIESCLACNEDMDAWRELEQCLLSNGGTLSLWAPAADSVDVVWAMKLEGFTSTVQIIDSQLVGDLGWTDLGTPVKVLLDNNCRPVKIAGRTGNKRDSKRFIGELLGQICPQERAAID